MHIFKQFHLAWLICLFENLVNGILSPYWRQIDLSLCAKYLVHTHNPDEFIFSNNYHHYGDNRNEFFSIECIELNITKQCLLDQLAPQTSWLFFLVLRISCTHLETQNLHNYKTRRGPSTKKIISIMFIITISGGHTCFISIDNEC